MSTHPQHASSPSSGDDRNLVSIDENYLAPTFEDRLRIFWSKNSRSVLAACALVLVVILGKGAYEVIHARQEKAVAADYAAATTDDQLKSFVASHGDHILGGLAQLRLADQAYAAGNFADARSAYDKAAGILKSDTFGQRARLGSAIAAVQTGANADGEAALKQISADLSFGKVIRSEATYHLASMAAVTGNTAEAVRLIEQVTVIDPEGQWADRASMLRTSLPAATDSASVKSTESVPSISFK
ncbi:tetratricopeptide repeat protein [Rariglobus hedericola]|uniref:Tetratricopeptide repeat protein n=1 Tax=Rariglobus hedericola TaxID=2597822 RepID=A0A556QRW3_9BACT|nr:tetratricopeptide repeat protein [Rariglobus hedericola]TSJ79387.1 tetratricopeptide repeat protein [Rariglobus hedericola]